MSIGFYKHTNLLEQGAEDMGIINKLITDSSMQIAQKALDGLGMRRDVLSQNIANVDTPAYKGQEVDFETALKGAINGTVKLNASMTQSGHMSGIQSQGGDIYQIGLRQGGSSRADGNNVDIDQELLQLTETGIRYQTLTSVVSRKLSLLKSIAQAR